MLWSRDKVAFRLIIKLPQLLIFATVTVAVGSQYNQ